MTRNLEKIGDIITIKDFEYRRFSIANIHMGGFGIVLQLVPLDPFQDSLALKTYQKGIPRYQFEKEAKIWFSVGNHPNIAKPHWYGFWKESPAILAEWYPITARNIDLYTWGIDKIKEFLLDLICGLKFAFDQSGVIHQDVKPDNILIDKESKPQLSDFGISVLFSDYNKNVGGTRGYIAPELLLGFSPSIKSDIYSLGITVLELLTKIRPSMKQDDQMSIRYKTLKEMGYKLGRDFTPIIRFIDASTQIDPAKRVKSYEELLSILGVSQEGNVGSVEKTDYDVVADALVSRKQGNIQDAIYNLSNYLEKDRKNPLVLNALGACYTKLGDNTNAKIHFKIATDQLLRSQGLNKNKLYCDPIANLSNIFIREYEFNKASDLLKIIWDWYEKIDIRILYSYPAVGWYLLYTGNFQHSCEILLSSYRIRRPDSWSLSWFTYSAYLTGNLKEWGMKIFQHLISIPHFDISSSINAILIADSINPPEQYKLHKKAIRDQNAELEEISNENGLLEGFLYLPLNPILKDAILNSLDQVSTGGKYYGVSR